MSAAVHIQINIIPFLALLIIRLNARESLSYTWRNRALRFGMVLMMGVIGTGTSARLLDGREGLSARFLLWLTNIIYFECIVFAAFLWYLYVYDIVKNEVGQRGKKVLRPAVPLIVFSAVLCTSPFYPLVFDIDADNYYVRGPFYLLYVGVSAFYVASSAVLVVKACRRETVRERRRTYWGLGSFAGFALLGGIHQVLFPGVEMLWPFLSIAFLIVYINVQQEQVTRDGLTGLNNRRRFDQYIRELAEQDLTRESWRFVILDVDRFKTINDAYGHVIGDRTLKLLAEQMKRVFGNRRSFLARYGGDEFVIILNGMSEKEAAEALEQLRKAVAGLHRADGKRWNITISAGMAAYGENGITYIPDIIALADERMYREKHVHHEEEWDG